MDIIIIEDERITAEDLRDTILQIVPEANMVKILSSVKEAVQYLKTHDLPQLIFSDIQLGDGLSFDIYQQVELQTPIIFCTAYDEYALKAFESNGIHYILKPFDERKIAEAIEKFQHFKSLFSINKDTVLKVIESFSYKNNEQTGSILVYWQNKVIPVKIKNIALFYIKNEITHLVTFDQKTYYVNKTLDVIQQICGDTFYRANRQYSINREAIKEVSQVLSRKFYVELTVPFSEPITVSKEKLTEFLNWLKGYE